MTKYFTNMITNHYFSKYAHHWTNRPGGCCIFYVFEHK